MRKRATATTPLWMCYLMLISLFPLSLYSQEGGGTSGADFLVHPPASRADAMGGVIDGMGDDFDGILLNPSVLLPDLGFLVQLNIVPLPNNVTHTQLGFGMPLLGGVMGASAQLLSAGQFTEVSGTGQPQASVSVYDAAAVLGYSHTVWKTISLGLNAKGIYRSLGSYNAFSFAVDGGAAAWFETPHIGQRPKPPTTKELERELEKMLKAVEQERESRIKDASRQAEALRKEAADLMESVSDLEQKLDAAEADKREPILTKLGEAEEALDARSLELDAAEEAEQEALSEIDGWYAEQTFKANARFQERVAELDFIEQERERLFSVISDPEKELTAEMVDDNIDTSISRTQEFISDRQTALAEAADAFTQKRRARMQGIQEEIADYQSQIDSETGPEGDRISKEIETVRQQIAGLEAAETDEDKTRLKEAQSVLSAKEKELQALLEDPWLKRLASRIQSKLDEIRDIEKEIQGKAEETAEASDAVAAQSAKDIDEFEALRESLQKDLKKAKLKRELDVLNANHEKAMDKARDEYKAAEKKIYTRLLSAMYTNEEKIFQVRLSSAKEDSQARRFDFELQLQQSRETLEDDFALQDRFIARKIVEAKREEGSEEELTTLERELKDREQAYKAGLSELDQKERVFDRDEEARLDEELDAIKQERQKIRLIFLQTDKPFLNTSVILGVRNLGTSVKFAVEPFPLPTSFTLGVGYTLLNIENHAFRLALQMDAPLQDDISLSVGAEYVLFDIAFLRAGYTFNSVERSFSAGFGARLALGFTEYAVDYTFRPIPDYGPLHSFGIHISF